MSPLVLLGAVATLLSTVTLLPHLVHAVRAGRPGGSTSGWTLGFLASLAWFVYGVWVGDLVVAAPGLVTLPVGAALAVWCFVASRRSAACPEPLPLAAALAPALVSVPAPRVELGDTLELPRIA
ncbi:hypothetical protein [Nocardioides solisilvae]|uniref:hypothetical protein n=1 Tax=Nocardioides solisilvae TaxID=1542435 RepID=UPI000D74BA4C|nr:hypothetical protein [Nocardioides solisilvae]